MLMLLYIINYPLIQLYNIFQTYMKLNKHGVTNFKFYQEYIENCILAIGNYARREVCKNLYVLSPNELILELQI